MKHWCNDIGRGKPKYWEKNCPRALSPPQTPQSEGPAARGVSHGMT